MMSIPPPLPTTNDAPVDLTARFPKMKRVKGGPFLFTLNGFGFSMSGMRDFDTETGTYIKTHTITALFIPIIGLGAYRVADAENGGWYFLGKERLRPWVSWWNYILIFSIASLIALGFHSAYTSSPDYKAKQEIAAAEKLLDQGNNLEAANLYLKALDHNSSEHNNAARAGFKQAITAGLESNNPPTVLSSTKALIESSQWRTLQPEFASLYQDSLERAKAMPASAYQTALTLIDTVKPHAGADTSWMPLKMHLLETAAAKEQPVSLTLAAELAEIYATVGEPEKTVNLLAPLAGQFGRNRPAYLLGSAYLSLGQAQRAIPLLEAYTATRRSPWADSLKKIDLAAEKAYQAGIDTLNNGTAPDSFYTAYDAAPTQEVKEQMVHEFALNHMEKDPSYANFKRTLQTYEDVPSALMDLGIAYLRAAQNTPSQRTEFLTKSEKTLLTLNSYAGDSQEYKLFLGQVYYWLGKSEKGKALFDSLLKDSGNNYSLLINLAHTLREIGIDDEAMKLSEKAYDQGKTKDEKSEAASLRSTLGTTLEDQIAWIEKANPSHASTIIRLNALKARQAWQKNNTTEAAALYKKAISGYDTLTQDSTNLNNAALLHFELFNVSGNSHDYEQGLQKLDKAVQLSPNQSILCANTAHSFLNAAIYDLIGDKLEPRMIQYGIGLNDLRNFYSDENERAVILAELKKHPHYIKSASLRDRALLLSPQNKSIYHEAIGIYQIARDLERLEATFQKMKESKVDFSVDHQEWLSQVSTVDKEEMKANLARSSDYLREVQAELKQPLPKALIGIQQALTPIHAWTHLPIEDIDTRLSTLKQLCTAHPSANTTGLYNYALSVKACLDLSQSNPTFAQWVNDARDQISPRTLLLLWLDQSENPQQVCKEHPSLHKALTSNMTLNNQFPTSYTVDDWCCARVLDSDNTNIIAKSVRDNQHAQLAHSISMRTHPHLPNTIVDHMWQLRLEGKEQEAKNYYNTARKTNPLLPEIF